MCSWGLLVDLSAAALSSFWLLQLTRGHSQISIVGGKFAALQSAVYSRMISINHDKTPIEVDSAFGGLGIYKKSAILSSSYIGVDDNREEFCEHVHLHTVMREKGLRLYIVPSLINCGFVGCLNPPLLKTLSLKLSGK